MLASAIKQTFPDIKVSLDVHHFLNRYLVTILGGVKNPHRGEVAKDIVDAILKTRATKDRPAVYRTQQEQESLLKEAYEKWARQGSVWSAATAKVHHDQLDHVQNGCLTRRRQDIRADGSRIEGSHKGWNSLQRSQPSGILMLTALGHDFVLRRNIRVGVNRHDAPPDAFTRSTFGSHHVQLVNSTAHLWNALLARQKPRTPTTLQLLPELPDVASQESFGCVESHHATSFGGLLEVKVEADDDVVDLSGSNSSDTNSGNSNGSSIEDIAQDLDISPLLLFVPDTVRIQARDNLALTIGSIEGPDSKDLIPGNSNHVAELFTPSKRRLVEMEAEMSAVKKTRTIDVLSSAPLNGQPKLIFPPKLVPALSPPLKMTISALSALLPIPASSSGSLTRSQRFFAITTGIDPSALSISSLDEFYLFMELRAQHQWRSYTMTSRRWVAATALYNQGLTERNTSKGLQTIKKKPRALMEKLGEVEPKIIERLQTANFKSKSGNETFWRQACHAVPLVKEGESMGEGKKRKPATCTRCRTIMYPGPTGSVENHRKGVCSDGVNPSFKAIEWPQPQGIFTNGTHFHPIPFLKAVREVYEAFVMHKVSSDIVPMEQDAFARLLASHTVVGDDGTVLFKLFDLTMDPLTPETLIVTYNGTTHLRLDCLGR